MSYMRSQISHARLLLIALLGGVRKVLYICFVTLHFLELNSFIRLHFLSLSLQKSDLEVIKKFEFVFELCTCIRRLARARDSSLSESLVLGRALPCHGSMATNEKRRRVEQFQLYVYALNLLSSAITLAQDLISDGKVKTSQTLKEGTPQIVC